MVHILPLVENNKSDLVDAILSVDHLSGLIKEGKLSEGSKMYGRKLIVNEIDPYYLYYCNNFSLKSKFGDSLLIEVLYPPKSNEFLIIRLGNGKKFEVPRPNDIELLFKKVFPQPTVYLEKLDGDGVVSAVSESYLYVHKD